MKRILGLLLIVSALCGLPLLAGKNSQGFQLPTDVTVGGVVLKAGSCKATWTEASGGLVQLTLKAADKSVTVPAKVEEEKHRGLAAVTAVVNGTTYLRKIQTTKLTIIIQDGPAAK
jgi:hypothetical protein